MIYKTARSTSLRSCIFYLLRMHFRRISSCKFAVVYVSIVFNDTVFHADFFFVSPSFASSSCDVGSSRISLCSVHLMCYVNTLNSFCAYFIRDCSRWGGWKKKSFIIFRSELNRWLVWKGRKKKGSDKIELINTEITWGLASNHLTMLIFRLILDSWIFAIDWTLLKLWIWISNYSKGGIWWGSRKVISINYSNELFCGVSLKKKSKVCENLFLLF